MSELSLLSGGYATQVVLYLNQGLKDGKFVFPLPVGAKILFFPGSEHIQNVILPLMQDG
jgi:hypothetical protein